VVSDGLLRSMVELTNVMQHERSLGPSLARVAEAAVASIPRCDSASVALSVEGRPATAAMSARIALELDLVQYSTGEGPCLRTMESATSMRIDLVEHDEEFPHFASGAKRLGVNAVLSLPATIDSRAVGTLNVYSRSGPFDETAEDIGRVLATQVAIALVQSDQLAASQAVADRAQREADEAAEVSMATGMLVAAEECTVEQAEGLLRGAARQDEERLITIARRIIAEHDRLRQQPDEHR
jgi:GAF domain-containing protein